MNWKKTSVAALTLMSVFASGVYADDVVKEVKAFLRPDMKVVMNGQEVPVQQPLLIYNGSSYVPLKTFGELLGAQVNWDEANFSVNVITSSTTGSSTDSFNPPVSSGSGTTMNPVPAPGPLVPSSPVFEGEKFETEIKIGEMLPYKFIYKGIDYPVLVNFYKDSMYLRLADVNKMGIPTLGARFSKEIYTDEAYIHISQVEQRWESTPKVDVYKGLIIEDETDVNKIKTLQSFKENDLNTTPLLARYHPDQADRYQVLCKTSENEYIYYTIGLRESNAKTGYTITNISGKYIKTSDDDNEDDDE